MEKLKDYLRFEEYSDEWVRVYTYNNLGKKVFLFGNKAKVLNLSLGFAFLDSEVLNVIVCHPSDCTFSECDEIDIIIKLGDGE
mgnify:CR=1 FL=1